MLWGVGQGLAGRRRVTLMCLVSAVATQDPPDRSAPTGAGHPALHRGGRCSSAFPGSCCWWLPALEPIPAFPVVTNLL